MGPVRIRSAAWSSASPDGREVGRLAAVHPIVGLLLVCASRTSSSRSSTTRTPEVHIAGTVDIDAPLHRTGGASYRFARTSRRCAHFSLISASEVIIACGQVGPALVHPHPVRSAHRRHAHRTRRDIEEKPHAVALSLRLRWSHSLARRTLAHTSVAMTCFAYLSRNDMFATLRPTRAQRPPGTV